MDGKINNIILSLIFFAFQLLGSKDLKTYYGRGILGKNDIFITEFV